MRRVTAWSRVSGADDVGDRGELDWVDDCAGLAPLRIHDLRHTKASLAIAAGADVKMLPTMLGHASAVMTLDRYGHLMPGRAQDVAERLDAIARTAVTETMPPVTRLDDFAG